jgi:hypothetical protein
MLYLFYDMPKADVDIDNPNPEVRERIKKLLQKLWLRFWVDGKQNFETAKHKTIFRALLDRHFCTV